MPLPNWALDLPQGLLAEMLHAPVAVAAAGAPAALLLLIQPPPLLVSPKSPAVALPDVPVEPRQKAAAAGSYAATWYAVAAAPLQPP